MDCYNQYYLIAFLVSILLLLIFINQHQQKKEFYSNRNINIFYEEGYGEKGNYISNNYISPVYTF